MSRISQITLDDSGLATPTPEIEQERRVAMFDLLEENSFVLPTRADRPAPQGPYHVGLAIREKRLVFNVNTEDAEKAAEFHLSLGPFRQVEKAATEPDRNDRYGAAGHSQRRVAGSARTTGGQGAGRYRHCAAPFHLDLCPSFRKLNEQRAAPISSILLRSQRSALAHGRGHYEKILRHRHLCPVCWCDK